ncbi:MAG: sulfatase [Ignavibacteriales bacterium]|nr:sulfatase [Ignavibacteriales bacterium]MCB9218162.1 sulfatase [Ignavibacteriales bacterium]
MIHKNIHKILYTFIFTFFWGSACTNNSTNDNRPNIVLILIDDLGWNDIGFMGSKFYETPNIDKLASNGMTFTNAYVTAPNCAPSRASLLTGQYTPRHHIYTVGTSERGKSELRKLIPPPNQTVLDTSKITIAEILQDKGYSTISIGKWHLGEDPDSGPEQQGFDINIGGNKSGHPSTYFSPFQNDQLRNKKENEYLTDRLNDEAVNFIEGNKDNPFFLYLSHYAVHTPIQAKKELIEKYDKKEKGEYHNNSTYAAMIQSVDEGVGKIVNTLDRLNLINNTIIIFLSDNGGFGGITSMHPLRGSKGMLYEGGIKVPMIISWPGKITANSVSNENVISLDIFPTLTDIINSKNPKDQVIDGISLTPILFEEKDIDREAIFWHFPAYLEGNYEGARDTFFRTRPCAALKVGDWKLIHFFENNDYELYNLKDDVGESQNLYKKRNKKAAELMRLLKEWQISINAPIPTEINPDYSFENKNSL